MTTAQWFTLHEHGGFPIECAALGACDLAVLHVGGEWQWLVRQAGHDVAEGAARDQVDAQRQAEAVALSMRPRTPSSARSSAGCSTGINLSELVGDCPARSARTA